jgi:2-methylisocitrate lyase-like PEP mutase family enzyme
MEEKAMRAAQRLRTLLQRVELIVAPGAYDGITARFIEQAGFDAVYMTGAGVSVANGFPDYGILTLSEMATAAGILARSVTIPVIADADTGYGNELNTTRTVHEYEMRGVAALQIEDQVAPKRCGHLDGKEIVPREEFVAKIAAAAAARRDPDLVLIARTDARAIAGLDEAVARANQALGAGADIAFIEAPRSMDEVTLIPRLVGGPCLLNLVPGGKTPDLALHAVSALGYRMVILPGLLLTSVLDACDAALATLRETGRAPVVPGAPSIHDRFRRLGAEEWDVLRRPAPQAAE